MAVKVRYTYQAWFTDGTISTGTFIATSDTANYELRQYLKLGYSKKTLLRYDMFIKGEVITG